MDLIQEGREKEREGGVEERRERWEVRGGEGKGAGTCTVLFSMCVCACVCATVYLPSITVISDFN